MLDVKVIAEQMRRIGMTETEISYELDSLEPISQAFTQMLDTFDDTRMALIFAPKKLERRK